MARKTTRRSRFVTLTKRIAGGALAAVLTFALPLHVLANEVSVGAYSSDQEDKAGTTVISDTGRGVRADADNSYRADIVVGSVTVDDSASGSGTTAVEAFVRNPGYTAPGSNSYASVTTDDVNSSSSSAPSTAVSTNTADAHSSIRVETGNLTSAGTNAKGVVTLSTDGGTNVFTKDVNVNGASAATGIETSSNDGYTSVDSGAVSVSTSASGPAYGVYLHGDGGEADAFTGKVTVESAGTASGVELRSDDGSTFIRSKGDITATGDSYTTGVHVQSGDYNANGVIKRATGEVMGDVTATATGAGSDATGVIIRADDGNEAAYRVVQNSDTGKVGNVSSSSSDGSANGLAVSTGDNGAVYSTVEGSVTAKAAANTASAVHEAVDTGKASIYVGKDVTAEGMYANGVVSSVDDGSSIITVSGDVTVQASKHGTGVSIYTNDAAFGSASSENHISQGGTIAVTSSGSEESFASGAYIFSRGGNASLYTDNITANGQEGAVSLDAETIAASGNVTAIAYGNVSATSSNGGATGIDADASQGKVNVSTGSVSASAGKDAHGVDVVANTDGYVKVETDAITSSGVIAAEGIRADATSAGSTVDVHTDGNVVVSASGTTANTKAYGIDAYSVGTEKIQVVGDVTATNTASEHGLTAGVGAGADGGVLGVLVTGAITADGSGNTYGIRAFSDNGGNTTVDTGDSVSASDTGNSYGVVISGADGTTKVNVNGNLSAESNPAADHYGTAMGVVANTTGSTVNVHVAGDVTADQSGDGIGNAVGIRMNAEDASQQTIKVEGDVSASGDNGTAVQAIADSSSVGIEIAGGVSGTYDSFGNGISADAANGGTVDIQVKDDVALNAPNGVGVLVNIDNAGSSAKVSAENVLAPDGDGIEIYQKPGAFSGTDSSVDIQVAKNVIAENYGIRVIGDSGENIRKNVVISETLSSKNSAVLFGEGTATDTLDLTVWKIETEAESLTEQRSNGHYDPAADDYVFDTNPAEDFEKNNIFYIIKLEQPATGGVLSVDGTTEKNGFATAKEGETVLLKVNLDPGYRITNAYNGLTEKVSLVQNEAGEYFIEVPKGGGVYLSVVLDNSIAPAPAPAPSAESQYWFQVGAVETAPAAAEAPALSQDASPADAAAETPAEAATEATTGAATAAAPAAPAEQTPVPAPASCAIVGAESCLTPAEVALLGTLPEKEQLLVVLHKVGFDGLIPELDFGYGPNTLLVSDAIASNIAPVISTETLEVDGMTATWNVIRVKMNGTVLKFIFWDNVTSWAHGWQN